MPTEQKSTVICSRCGGGHTSFFGSPDQADDCAVLVEDGVVRGHYGSSFDLQVFNIIDQTRVVPVGSFLCDHCIVRLVDIGAIGLGPLEYWERFTIYFRFLGFMPNMFKRFEQFTQKLRRRGDGINGLSSAGRLGEALGRGDAAGARYLLAACACPSEVFDNIAKRGPHQVVIAADADPADAALLIDLASMTGHARMRLAPLAATPLATASCAFQSARRKEAEAKWASKERKLTLTQ